MIISAIKIDVVKKEVYQVQIENNLEGLYEAIDCETVECIRINQSNDLWLDEEGLLHYPQPPKFLFLGYPSTLTGYGLVCGFDGEGQSISATFTAEEIESRVLFLGDIHIETESGFIPWDELL